MTATTPTKTRREAGWVGWLVAWLVVLPPAANAAGEPYQGFGATTPGGAGQAVVVVTNLQDSAPQHLRESSN